MWSFSPKALCFLCVSFLIWFQASIAEVLQACNITSSFDGLSGIKVVDPYTWYKLEVFTKLPANSSPSSTFSIGHRWEKLRACLLCQHMSRQRCHSTLHQGCCAVGWYEDHLKLDQGLIYSIMTMPVEKSGLLLGTPLKAWHAWCRWRELPRIPRVCKMTTTTLTMMWAWLCHLQSGGRNHSRLRSPNTMQLSMLKARCLAWPAGDVLRLLLQQYGKGEFCEA